MLHDAPLDFIWLGVMLERVGQTARMLDVHHHAFASGFEGNERDSRPRCGSSLLRALLGLRALS